MFGLKSTFALAFLAISAVASPVDLEKRQSATTCGSVSHSAAAVKSASSHACTYVESGEQIGSNDYPHIYNNYEGFDFPVSGPYYEFPLMASGVYSGGSPGADRVVINENCAYAGAITHTGASGNNFVGCSGTS